MFVGVNITFFVHHFLGVAGLPRKYPDYNDTFYLWNNISSKGSNISIISGVMFLCLLLMTVVTINVTVDVNCVNFELNYVMQVHNRNSSICMYSLYALVCLLLIFSLSFNNMGSSYR